MLSLYVLHINIPKGGHLSVKRIYDEWLLDYLRHIRAEEHEAAVEYELRVAKAKSEAEEAKRTRKRANKDKYLDQLVLIHKVTHASPN
jgi:hypothetical protein